MAFSNAPIPADIIHLICEELSYRTDFSTLYNCLISSKLVASSGAINALYRISHECFGQSSIDGSTIEDAPAAEARQVTQKNSILWRTITLSALGETLYPYCRHLRVLDLRDLGGMLQDDTFRTPQIFNYFFSGSLSKFQVTQTNTRSKRVVDQLKIKDTVAKIGDTIIDRAPLLEALTEHAIETVFGNRLEAWIPKLSHLRRLDLGDGRILSNQAVRSLIHTHCSNLSELRIFSAYEDSDISLAALLNGLPENTITLFENISDCQINIATCTALNRHSKSLCTLSLALMHENFLALTKLVDCTKLVTFAIDWLRPTHDLYSTKKNECDEIAEWIKTCHSLKEVSLKNVAFAPELLLPAFRGDNVKLKVLTLIATESALYDIRAHTEFHLVLGRQQELEELLLAANADEASLQDRAVLLSGLCSLKSLRKLRVTRLADDFVGPDLQELSEHLLNLEDFYVGGIGYTDDNLRSLSKLRKLKNLVIAGLSRFTADGLLDFVLSLGEGNRGISLQVDLADFDYALTEQQQAFISETLATSVGGIFRYALSRDPNLPEYDSSDSD